jgi:hypothetical protein
MELESSANLIVRGNATTSLGHASCHLSDMAPMPGNIVALMLQDFRGTIAGAF